MTMTPHTTRRRALPLCLGLLLATAGLAGCDRRTSSETPPRDPGGSTTPSPTTPPPEMPSSDPSVPPASGPRP